MDSYAHLLLKLVFWNVRGLGDNDKCSVVRDNLVSANPFVVCLQETKLASHEPVKLRAFIPPQLSESVVVDADGSRGGLLTAWNPNHLSLVSSISRVFSLTTVLASTTADLSFTITNVYAPADHSLSPAFAEEMVALRPLVTGAWLIAGDFNLIRYPSEKNNNRFNVTLAALFNDLIHSMGWFELPLLDRRFTWSNMQDVPTLARLDRVFFN
jgi:exonuclease III